MQCRIDGNKFTKDGEDEVRRAAQRAKVVLKGVMDGVYHSSYFHEASKRAQIPFSCHEILECGSNGLKYTNADHDMSLIVPEGALTDGKKIHFEIGVAMYGPFNFPDSTQPISPILWLHILEEDTQLEKAFSITLPHFLVKLTKENAENYDVAFAKARHDDYTIQDKQIYYNFKLHDSKPSFSSSGDKHYGTIETKHCCYFCIMEEYTENFSKNKGYTLVRIQNPRLNQLIFCVTFFLPSCRRVSYRL